MGMAGFRPSWSKKVNKNRYAKSWYVAVILLCVMPMGHARGDILDDIFDLAKSAKTYAQAARDRATEARNNAAAARDSAYEIRDDLRENAVRLTDDMRDAISNAVDDLQHQLLEEREGLDEFTAGPNSCSLDQCDPFRSRLIDLLEETQTVLNAVLVISKAEELQIDFQRERKVLESIPGRLLFPLYRTHLFDDETLIEALRAATGDLVIVADAIQDDKDAACAYISEHREEVETATHNLEDKERLLHIISKLFMALGKVPVQPDAGAWGWVGIVAKLEPAEKIGGALDAVADALKSAADASSKRLKSCKKGGSNHKLNKNQRETMKNVEKLLTQQEKILDGQRELRKDVDRILKILGDDRNP